MSGHAISAERRQRIVDERRMKIHDYSEIIPTSIKREAERMWRSLPPDTRQLTARLMGDPIKGRSALDQRSWK